MAHDVFVAHCSLDKPSADAACAVLESKGLRCWIAPRDILPGSDWSESIVDAINSSKAMVLIFSRHAGDSPQIKREVELAVHRGLPIVPVRIEDVLPAGSLQYFLATQHWLDAFVPPLERHLENLAEALQLLLAGPTREARTRPAPSPLAPVRKRRLRLAALVLAGTAFVILTAYIAWHFAGLGRNANEGVVKLPQEDDKTKHEPSTKPEPPPGPRVPDADLKPTYGEVALKSGFRPDPYAKSVLAGGKVTLQKNGVAAFVATNPDFILDFEAGKFSLAIYAESTANTALIVKLPDGTWAADDNRSSKFHGPLVHFRNPPSGRYLIWVGLVASNPGIADAVLKITEIPTKD
jgi:hypothetical protein